jgi:hypothetical protein
MISSSIGLPIFFQTLLSLASLGQIKIKKTQLNHLLARKKKSFRCMEAGGNGDTPYK